jgi:hypothetical protein
VTIASGAKIAREAVEIRCACEPDGCGQLKKSRQSADGITRESCVIRATVDDARIDRPP